jgi:hypothetical protein
VSKSEELNGCCNQRFHILTAVNERDRDVSTVGRS